MNAQAHKRLGAMVVLMAVAATFAAAISALSHEQTSSMHIEQEPPEEAAGSILPSEAVAADRFWPPEPRTKETWFNISHILVAHREAIFADSPLWLPGAAPNRSRDAARAKHGMDQGL